MKSALWDVLSNLSVVLTFNIQDDYGESVNATKNVKSI